MLSSPARLLLTVAAAGLCGACAPSQHLVVEVRDIGTQEPLPGIAVKVTTLNPQHALRASDWTRWLLGGPAADEHAILTDNTGRVEVPAPTDRPFLVSFVLPGLIPESLEFGESGEGITFARTDWIDLPITGDADVKASCQVRIGPAGGSPRS